MIENDKRPNRHLQVRKVANILDCAPDHIYLLIKTGQLKAIKLGPRALRVCEESLKEFIRSREVEPCESIEKPA